MFKGKVFWQWRSVAISLLLTYPLAIMGQAIEQEPNDPCTSAQLMGAILLPTYIDGNLDVLDVDFFRFSAVPDTPLVANLDGIGGDLVALSDPYLGLFDSSCNLLAVNDDFNGTNSQLNFTVPADGEFILAATSCCDSTFTGSVSTGSYRLTLDTAATMITISGRVVDADTGIGVPGDVDPYAQVALYECWTDDCSSRMDIGYQYTDHEGHFYFDSSWYGQLMPGVYQLQITANNYLTTTTDPLVLTDSQQLDLGDILLEPVALGDSIRGRLIDAVTGEPLSGTSWPFAYADLNYCADDPSCTTQLWVNGLSVNTDGTFLFQTDYAGNGLAVGWYIIHGSAIDYSAGESCVFELIENEQEDVGDIELIPPPVSFSEVRPCGDLPPEGGKCRYSVRITSNLPVHTTFGAWSLVQAYGIGSELGWTEFQADRAKIFDLYTGQSMVVRFSFDVPADVQNGASICPDIWAGLSDESPYFDTLANRNPLFCITKGLTGTYSLLTKQAAQALVKDRQSKLIHK